MRNVILLFVVIASSMACGETVYDDDTGKMLKLFERATDKHDVIKIKAGTYYISEPMPELTHAVVVMGVGRAVIVYTGIGPFITVAARNVEIHGLIIQGDDVSSGILAHDSSWLTIENMTLIDLDIALELDYFHDSNFNNIKFYSNNIDFLADKGQITSIKFTRSHFELSNYAVKINAPSTNLSFINGAFAPIGTDNPIQITKATFSGLFSNNRFEIKGAATALHLNAASHNFPVQGMKIINNYFTGPYLVTGIRLGRYTNNNTITGNHFQVDPTESDITDEGIKNVLITNNHPSVHLNRELIVN